MDGEGPYIGDGMVERLRERLTDAKFICMVAAISAIAMLLAYIGPGSASAATVGIRDITGFQGTYVCPAYPCTFSNLRVSEGTAQSPIAGTITRWRVNMDGPATARLQVLKRTVDEPGFAADEFRALRETPDETTVRGKNVFDASLSVRKGNFIGLVYSGFLRTRHGPRARFGIEQPAFIPGDPASSFSSINPDQADLLFNATVRGGSIAATKGGSCNPNVLRYGGRTYIFYKEGIPCERAKRLAHRVQRTRGDWEPPAFNCTSGSNFRTGGHCQSRSRNELFGWHPRD